MPSTIKAIIAIAYLYVALKKITKNINMDYIIRNPNYLTIDVWRTGNDCLLL